MTTDLTGGPGLTEAEAMIAARRWLDANAADRPVETALGRLLSGDGDTATVVVALARYQNEDGGFGHGLEPDISAPQSNPFAARLALSVVIEAGIAPDAPIVAGLVDWLEREQSEDGCWRWQEGTLDHPVAPWFAGWEFPALNPALDLAGLLARLGLGSERLHRRCRDLYARLADRAEIETGAYYVVLPYAESLPWLPDLPDRDASLAALASRIGRDLAAGAYTTPQEAAEHIGPADGPVARLLPDGSMRRLRAEVVESQQPDGHWAASFGDHWDPWQTVHGMELLRQLPT